MARRRHSRSHAYRPARGAWRTTGTTGRFPFSAAAPGRAAFRRSWPTETPTRSPSLFTPSAAAARTSSRALPRPAPRSPERPTAASTERAILARAMRRFAYGAALAVLAINCSPGFSYVAPGAVRVKDEQGVGYVVNLSDGVVARFQGGAGTNTGAVGIRILN